MLSNSTAKKHPSLFQYKPNLSDNELIFSLVQEYCKLSKRIQPSPEDINRITAILELAQYDEKLNALIDDADDLLAYELGLCDFAENCDSFESYVK